MAEPFEVPGLKITGLVAGADLTAKQYLAVKLTESGTVDVVAAVTDKVIGILQNAPDSGEAAEVMVSGVSYLKAGDTIDVSSNPTVGSANDGECVAYAPGTDTTKYIVGTALRDAAAGDIVAVLLGHAARGA